MDKQGFIEKLRMYLADAEGKIWDDVELDRILEDALEQYSIDSGFFVGSFDFYPDAEGNFNYPNDGRNFMIGWNKKGDEITATSGKELFSKMEKRYSSGDAKYIYDDRSTLGQFKLLPDPGVSQNVQNITITPAYGEVMDDDFGVGISEDYGLTLTIDSFDYAGVIYYRKKGRFEDVRDHMAIIFYALSCAFKADSQFANPANAEFWRKQYQMRVANGKKVVFRNSGNTVETNFF